ncbi:MAG: alpha/beta fold hydrolase [Alphaproteobacteria bacterium]|nr:alpha/beta fold hydrolase [Alphaproteobacteria bacterium]
MAHALELAVSEFGAGPPVLIVHGLFGSKRNWTAIAKRLSRRHRVLTVDLRNHGESPWDSDHRYESLAEDLASVIKRRCSGHASVVGHSMGGKAAMALALAHPHSVERLVVVDIAPAPSGGTLIDYIETMSALPLAAYSKRADVEQALADEIDDPAIRSFLAHNIQVSDGALRWRLNLAALEENFDAIMGFPTFPHGKSFGKQTLFIAGAKSDYIQPHHQAEIDRLFPRSEIEIVPGAGHWVHAEAPGPFLDLVQSFLGVA